MGISVHRPESAEEAVRLKGQDPDALFLAGGQTLVAMINAELVVPAALISLDRIANLGGIDTHADGAVRIGAMTRHAEIAASDRLIDGHAVIREAARVIAHPAIRNLGTIGGAVSHGDPNADYPAALVAADARVEVLGSQGSREIAAGNFFKDFLTTDLKDGEMVTAVTLPASPAGARSHYEKFARVDGDYATVSVAVSVVMNANATVDWVRIAVGACGPRPVRVAAAEESLIGGALSYEAIQKAAQQIAAACDPIDDVRGSADYRLLLVPRLIAKAVKAAGSGRGA
ncbi:MAG TPA: xanthine dehydrogenase family protein subunit M [Alphaproteobacteria bacterium]|nr:xanthine dehydrogenase family protein subunit M [Alphaproteobacteria bacterium]